MFLMPTILKKTHDEMLQEFHYKQIVTHPVHGDGIVIQINALGIDVNFVLGRFNKTFKAQCISPDDDTIIHLTIKPAIG